MEDCKPTDLLTLCQLLAQCLAHSRCSVDVSRMQRERGAGEDHEPATGGHRALLAGLGGTEVLSLLWMPCLPFKCIFQD